MLQAREQKQNPNSGHVHTGKMIKKKEKNKTAKKTEEEALLWVPGLLPSYTRSILGAGTGHLCLPVNPSSWPKSLDERKD